MRREASCRAITYTLDHRVAYTHMTYPLQAIMRSR